ncbi:GMC oxidoreductase [Streptomyces sp. NBC_00356]|uniref:GMC oxidoreductase n=1 Tax=Streptomyces sp. NBC_00356 TaxID=2975724 RepID=UPI002E261DCE
MTRTFPRGVDVAVVGSGPCGAAVARTLGERAPHLTVAVFEAGPQLTATPGQHIKSIADPAARAVAQRRSQGPGPVADGRTARPGTYLLPDGYRAPGEDGLPAAAMSRNVGGMGAHWTGACPRPGESERIGFLPGLDGLLDEAERLLAVRPDAFDDVPFTGLVRERLAAAFDTGRGPGRTVRAMPLAVHRAADGRVTWSGADVVLGPTTPRTLLYADAHVRRVRTDHDRVTGVTVRDLVHGGEHEVAARAVVVAADALRTPQLLWASGIRPTALGRYLNDQHQVVFAARLADVPDAAQAADGDATAAARHSGVSWVPYTDAEPFHGQVMQLDASPVPLASDDVPLPGSIVGLGWFCAKDLRAEDRVTFDDNRTDADGMPAPGVHYTLTDRDRAALESARKAVRRAAEALGSPIDPEPITLPLGSSLHYQGTVRMGEADDGTSVCDPDGQVWNTDGLYVAGNGVIPTATACNPTLTSVALAVGTARRIAAVLG